MSQTHVKNSMLKKLPCRLRTSVLQPYKKGNHVYYKRKDFFYKSCLKFRQQIYTEGGFHNPEETQIKFVCSLRVCAVVQCKTARAQH